MKKHVFLIDDDKDELKSFLAALEHVPGDFKCTYAASAEQAIEMLKFLTPDYIFSDIGVPVMGGLKLTEQLRKLDNLSDTSLFLYSSDSVGPEIHHKAIALGITKCFEIPLNTIKLAGLLKTMLAPASLQD